MNVMIEMTACDGQKFKAKYWKSISDVRGTVQILHGMSEHHRRYQELAKYLNEDGFHVIAHDHRGHGNRISSGKMGHFADSLGWDLVVDDAIRIGKKALELHKGPLFLLGHSMGSFIAQKILTLDEIDYRGYILTGTDYLPRRLYQLSAWIPKLECLRLGMLSKSSLIQTLTFGRFNSAIKGAHTGFDWISTNPTNVQNYLTDIQCGFTMSSGAWLDLLNGLAGTFPPRLPKLKTEKAVLICNGAEDPISSAQRLEWLRQKLQSIGCSVTVKILPKQRHEVLQEKNRRVLFANIHKWMKKLSNVD